ncbi:Protein Asterix [Porphyridium purpureum]|uniref:Protein Asterix n=1 Tax=Porphyridium purpureum TaxID=35688 RepID=A0A5J4Z686_PORPP|nr:Protein Asterix [Porphyridium purpureum]|eukprot:POR1898..scf295_1
MSGVVGDGGAAGSAPRVVPFKHVVKPAEDAPVDAFMLLSMVCGVFVLVFKIRMYCWFTLLFFMASVANSKASEVDSKQLISSFFLVLMTFYMGYIGPMLAARAG